MPHGDSGVQIGIQAESRSTSVKIRNFECRRPLRVVSQACMCLGMQCRAASDVTSSYFMGAIADRCRETRGKDL